MPGIHRTAFALLLAAGAACSVLNSSIAQPAAGPKDQPPADAKPAKPESGRPQNSVTIEVRDGFRYLSSNGIPDHETGAFPNRHNPNSVRAQRYTFRVPEKPTVADKPTALGMRPFGVAVNGVVFDPGTAEWWRDDRSSGWHMEAIGGPRNLGLDSTNAHVQPSGAYHYHGIPSALLARLGAAPGCGP